MIQQQTYQFTSFASLDNHNVITSRVSDHHPIVHNGILFWNIMMQCNKRKTGTGFNNGFGMIETESDYILRLLKVATVIAELVSRLPSIKAICLCEGPIDPVHCKIFWFVLSLFSCMKRFTGNMPFYTPDNRDQNWGLLMLADNQYTVTKIPCDCIEKYPQLRDRIQLWKLKNCVEQKYLALAHFPFGSDETKTESSTLSKSSQDYCTIINSLLEQYSNELFTFCADFNFNPYLINQWKLRALDNITPNNSILLTHGEKDGSLLTSSVTVDGMLLSQKEKQILHRSKKDRGLYKALQSEYVLFKTAIEHQRKERIEANNRPLRSKEGPTPFIQRKLL